MQFTRRRIVFVKTTVIALAAFLGIFGFPSFFAKLDQAQASASGPSASHTNAPNEDNCTTCHTSFPVNSGAGRITLSDFPVNYLPNQQIPVTVTVSQSDAVIFGFQLTAIDSMGRKVGTYTVPAQAQTQMQTVNGIVAGNQRQYIEHTVDGVIPTQFGSKSWTFTWKAPAQRVGKVNFYAAGNAANSDNTTSGDRIYTTSKSTLSGTAIADLDGDGRTDISVFRPSSGVWYYLKSRDNGFSGIQFGKSGDVPVAADYDGDGRSDIAVWRPEDGVWYVIRSSDAAFVGLQFGLRGDVPVSGDYDGDGKSDYAVYRPSSGVWYLMQSSRGFTALQFGLAEDMPASADFDGDGRMEISVYRPSSGVWYILNLVTNQFSAVQFGLPEDKPVVGDYDGDGKFDIAVYRPSSGMWYLLNSTTGFSALQFGISTDKPAPADYDGDGKTDIAVYRASEGKWYIFRSLDNTPSEVYFGLPEDIPIP